MQDKLIRFSDLERTDAEVITRVPLGTGATEGSVHESELQDILFRFPQTMPIAAIDPAYDGIVPVCKELNTSAGFVDAFFVNPLGKLVLAEFKLWRNPQARREVIGQILDYTKELASWSYEDLQRVVSLKTGKKGNVLYDIVRKQFNDLSEAEFVDSVTRHLSRGEFLLLIIGDGIQEGVENIIDFVQRHSGLHFNLALVEAALYRDSSNHLLVHPRVLARTEIVQRFVVEGETGVVVPVDIDDTGDGDQSDTLSELEQENLKFWNLVVDGFSFSDTTVEIKTSLWPVFPKDSTVYIQIENTSYNGWSMFFGAFLNRNQRLMGCYLSVRKGQAREIRIYESLRASFDELQKEIGRDLTHWLNSVQRPRIGFKREGSLSFLSGSENDINFQDAVSWMQDHLNRLVSHLHPRLQSMLKDSG